MLAKHKLCNTRALFKPDDSDVGVKVDVYGDSDSDFGNCCHKHLCVWHAAFVVRHGSSEEQRFSAALQRLKLFTKMKKKTV